MIIALGSITTHSLLRKCIILTSRSRPRSPSFGIFLPLTETLEWLLYLVSFHQKKYHPFYSKRSRNDIDGQKIYIYLKKINKTDLGVD